MRAANITAIDPGDLDYGAGINSLPYFDAVVLANSLSFFDSIEHIKQTSEALRTVSKTLLIAEWSLQSAGADSEAHVVAARAQAEMSKQGRFQTCNIRTLVDPKPIQDLAEQAQWACLTGKYFTHKRHTP